MADFPGMTIATPRIPIYPSVSVPSLYGTTSKLTPGKTSDALMESVLRDYENSMYRTDMLYEPSNSSSSSSTSSDALSSTQQTQMSSSSPPGMIGTRVLSATTIPSFLNFPKVPIPSTSPSLSSGSDSSSYRPSSSVPSPFSTTLNGMTQRVYTSGLATSLEATSSGVVVGPQVERSLSIHTPTFKGATPEQLMSSYLQDLSCPSQVIDCDKFINWTDFVSTWSYDERQKREQKISV